MALQVVGSRVKRYDGLAHVTGETKFADDWYAPNQLYIKALRTPVHKGRIKKLDTSEAEKAPGVACVLTAKDLKVNIFGWGGDQPILAAESFRHEGELMAVVAAESEDAAWEAVQKIKYEIEEETPVFDMLEAVKPDAPKVRPEGNLHMWGNRPYRQIVFGDIEAGFKKADTIVESEYHHGSAKHAQLEPHVSLAVPEAGGKITIHTCSQCLHFHLGALCGIFGLPMNKVHLVGGTVGGGFGSKNDIHTDHITGIVALKTGRPAKWRWTREEDLKYSSNHGAWHMWFKDGVTKDGAIVARRQELSRSGRVPFAQSLRGRQALLPGDRPVLGSERLRPGLLRPHQQAARQLDARVRHHAFQLCHRIADGQDRRDDRHGQVGDSVQECLS